MKSSEPFTGGSEHSSGGPAHPGYPDGSHVSIPHPGYDANGKALQHVPERLPEWRPVPGTLNEQTQK